MIVKWEGIVDEVDESSFTAELYPIFGEELEDHWAEIKISAVPNIDHHRIVPGAVFYWRMSDTEKSIIHFRRFVPKLPSLVEVRESGTRLSLALGWL